MSGNNFKINNYLIIDFTCISCIVSYMYGIYSYPRNLWPLESLRGMRNSSPYLSNLGHGNYDKLGRLINYPGKIKTSRPNQLKKMGILLVAGQSNSANYGEKVFNELSGQGI